MAVRMPGPGPSRVAARGSGAAVEETNAEGAFEIGDRFGNRRLGNGQI